MKKQIYLLMGSIVLVLGLLIIFLGGTNSRYLCGDNFENEMAKALKTRDTSICFNKNIEERITFVSDDKNNHCKYKNNLILNGAYEYSCVRTMANLLDNKEICNELKDQEAKMCLMSFEE